MNENAKYTPRPWRVGARYGHLQDEITAREGSQVIGSIFTRRWDIRKDVPYLSIIPDPEGQANLALTLAAPKLLEALEHLIDAAAWHGSVYEGTPDLTGERVRNAVKEARAAIAAVKEEA